MKLLYIFSGIVGVYVWLPFFVGFIEALIKRPTKFGVFMCKLYGRNLQAGNPRTFPKMNLLLITALFLVASAVFVLFERIVFKLLMQ